MKNIMLFFSFLMLTGSLWAGCGCAEELKNGCNMSSDCRCVSSSSGLGIPDCADTGYVDIDPGSAFGCNENSTNGKECEYVGQSVCYRWRACVNGSTSIYSWCSEDGSFGQCTVFGIMLYCNTCSPSGPTNYVQTSNWKCE